MFHLIKNTDNIKRYWNLILKISWFDFKLKYYGSIFGLLWSFLKPLFMLATLYLVFFYFLKVGIDNYPIYLLLGIVFWNFFADTTKDVPHSIMAKVNILQKTNLPPLAVVLSTVFQSLWTFVINLIVFFIFFHLAHLHIRFASTLIFIFLILFLFLFTAGVALFITPFYIRFRDFSHIWDIFLQMFFWLTPIAYEYKSVSSQYLFWYLLNPLTRIIIDARNVTLYNFIPEYKQLLITLVAVLMVFIFGLLVFKKYIRISIEEM